MFRNYAAILVLRTELDGVCLPPDMFACNMDVGRRSRGWPGFDNAAVVRYPSRRRWHDRKAPDKARLTKPAVAGTLALMDDSQRQGREGGSPRAASPDRRARLAAALRQNLQKRKAQLRARAGADRQACGDDQGHRERRPGEPDST
jgi:hypothetical protein